MAKEKKAQKKTPAQVKSDGGATLNENEFGYPAYGYGPEGFYGYPGSSDYPYPAISQVPAFSGDESSSQTQHFRHPYCPPYAPYYPPYYRHPYQPYPYHPYPSYPYPSYPYPC
jgi:hypothetical protein